MSVAIFEAPRRPAGRFTVTSMRRGKPFTVTYVMNRSGFIFGIKHPSRTLGKWEANGRLRVWCGEPFKTQLLALAEPDEAVTVREDPSCRNCQRAISKHPDEHTCKGISRRVKEVAS